MRQLQALHQKKKYKGKIIDVVENGYHIGDNILRFAKVVTGS